ncbi:mevalonate kinase [Lentibacillus amyloliquefaciens]|uniref:mevalonate kinase n=1 Tax=Lentibacillus amyloliquefaciens TaxID=1472767 RepID=A0A0U4E925_9BACI|nr:mevalonate kinase [Lentibacillus amyloliquefaciens]ALX49345.1 mevalonate kinase [Lentibacillus amyloliquefaciens]
MSIEKATTSVQTATGVAHSKLILIGEHAVVHGQPAISLPFPLVGVEAIIDYVPGSVKIDSTFYHGPIDSAPDSLNGLASCIRATLDDLEMPCEDLLIRIKSSIPPGKGLGSSASVSVAVIRALFAYAEEDYEMEDILRLADISERHAHGEPSGIDTLTISSEMPIWYQKEGQFDMIEPQGNFHFIVADSGRMGDTRLAVESVTNLIRSAPRRIHSKLERLGEITHRARTALESASKHLLGHMLNEAQKELEALGVSDAGLNRLIYIARQEGALGAKLTGGGNGGCVIALAKNEVHSKHLCEKLKKFGAHAVWSFSLNKKAD